MPGLLHAVQSVLASGVETKSGAGDGAWHPDLAGRRESSHPGRKVHADTDEVITALLNLGGVQSGPNREAGS